MSLAHGRKQKGDSLMWTEGEKPDFLVDVINV